VLNGRWDALDVGGPLITVQTEYKLSADAIDAIEQEVRATIGLPRLNR
jgi:hypothetical protein